MSLISNDGYNSHTENLTGQNKLFAFKTAMKNAYSEEVH